MSYNKEDYIRVKAEFSTKYLKAQSTANERRLELHARFPEVHRIDAILSRTGMDIMGVITRGGSESELAQIRTRNDALLAQRAQILREHGYEENYSDIRYECELCKDEGFVDTRMCSCMKRALVEAGYESSGLGSLIRTQSFDNFSLEFYRTADASMEDMKRVLAGLRRFAETFDRETYCNYLLIGRTGLGKTHLSTSVAKTVIERGFDVLYVTAVDLFRDFEYKHFGKGEGMKHELDRYVDAELLIIDDLGTEVCNQFTLSCLYDVINSRINAHRSTFINTNLSVKELEARYHERITSRLLGEYYPILFKGTDIRKQKLHAGRS